MPISSTSSGILFAILPLSIGRPDLVIVMASAGNAVEVQKLKPRCLQPLYHDTGKALHQGISEVMIRITFGAQALSIKAKGTCQDNGLGIEMPTVRRKEPRPPEHLVVLNGGDGSGASPGDIDL